MRLFLTLLVFCAPATAASAHHAKTFTYIEKPHPKVHPAAWRSGYCCMTYDIQADGETKNVKAGYCTDEIYRTTSIQAVENWIYAKTRQDGTPVAEDNLTASVAYRIEDFSGVPVPGPNSFMTPLPDGEYYMERVCSPLVS